MSELFNNGVSNRVEWVGRVLVVLQFGLLAMLGWRVFEALSGWTAWTTPVLAVAALVGLWSLTANRPGNFNIRPTPRDNVDLITAGPYRWVRHPMYASVLLAASALASVSHQEPAALGVVAAWVPKLLAVSADHTRPISPQASAAANNST